MEVFTNSAYGKITGQVYTGIVLLINTVILLNFVIAIMADTYSKLSSQSLGIYYDGIIARIPVYEYDPRYGALIVTTPPFSFLSIVLVPLFLATKDEKVLTKWNLLHTKVSYSPMALMLTVLFMALNLVLLPFAYLVAIYKKLKLILGRKKLSKELRLLVKVESSSWADLVMFVILGPLILLFA